MLRKFPTIFAEQDLLERIIEERERHLYIPCELIFAWALQIAENMALRTFKELEGGCLDY